MKFCLPQKNDMFPIFQWEELFRITPFSLIGEEYRQHLKQLGLPSYSSSSIQVLPYIFHVSKRVNSAQLKVIDGLAEEFLGRFDRSKFVIFQVGGCPHTLEVFEGHYVYQESCRRGNPYAKCLHYYCDNPSSTTPISLCRTRASFQGYVNNKLRAALCRDLAKVVRIVTTNRFFHHLDQDDAVKARLTYHQLLGDSKYVLCPRGSGENSIRFFETLANARVPVLISDCTMLPLEFMIPYEEFVVRVPETEIINLEDYLNHNDEQLERMSLKARRTFLKYFSGERLLQFLALSISEGEFGL